MPDKPYRDDLNISSNVLFHFTSSLKNLINILMKDFSPRFCPEYRLFESVDSKKPKPPEFATAMICFCDLPFSLIKKHLRFYGSYGIGLTKKWGLSKGITPVMYVHPQSKTVEPLRNLAAMVTRLPKTDMDLESEINSLACYTKPYEGPAWRSKQLVKHVKFYDEREWRYVPILLEGRPEVIHRFVYTNRGLLSSLTTDAAAKCKLTFTPNDVEYIIVKEENEILPMIHYIEKTKGKYGLDEAKILTTAIMSANRIWEDF